MSIHLVGGGRTASWRPTLYGPFATEATRHRALRPLEATTVLTGTDRGRPEPRDPGPRDPGPRIGIVVVVDDPAAEGAAAVGWFVEALGLEEVEVVPYVLAVGDAVPAGTLTDLDGILVGGGLTPAYHRALAASAADLADLVADGVPYLGFSAGAMIASQRALVGGWRLGERVVCSEDNAEDLDQLSVGAGLGLVPFGVDVHLAQWGNLSRLVAAVGAGLLTGEPAGVGIDEDTAVIWDGTQARVVGAGQAWWCAPTEGGVEVRMLVAGRP